MKLNGRNLYIGTNNFEIKVKLFIYTLLTTSDNWEWGHEGFESRFFLLRESPANKTVGLRFFYFFIFYFFIYLFLYIYFLWISKRLLAALLVLVILSCVKCMFQNFKVRNFKSCPYVIQFRCRECLCHNIYIYIYIYISHNFYFVNELWTIEKK